MKKQAKRVIIIKEYGKPVRTITMPPLKYKGKKPYQLVSKYYNQL